MKNILLIVLLLGSVLPVSAQSSQDILKGLNNGKKVKVKPEYNFSGSVKFEVDALHEGRALKGQQVWYFPTDNESILGITMRTGNTPDIKSVIDYADKAMIMFMEDRKMVMGMPLDMDKAIADMQKDPKYKSSTPKKTGRTKVIMGYTCDEWTAETAEHNSSFWMSQKLPVQSAGFYKIMAQQLFQSTGSPMPQDMKGIPLEIQATGKKNKNRYSMICTEVSNKPVRFTTAGYKTM